MEIPVIYLDFPSYRVRAFVSIDCDENYTIFVNARLSYEMQQEAIRHELAHIEQNHFYTNEEIVAIEQQANECQIIKK